MDYLGEKCPVCNKEFTADDDIVVCPDCGTPHHRECYAANGKCAHEEYHFIGRRWEKKADDKLASTQMITCKYCGMTNIGEADTCKYCGAKLGDNNE